MRPTFPTLLLIALIPTVVHADGQRSERDIPYSDAGGTLTRLDIYAPAEGKEHPVVVWIHGGGWRRGDKGNVQHKPAAFTSKGYVLVSINYRLYPDVSYEEQGSDIARAIRWVREHIGDYGGNPERLFLMGHSAGAHLAALVATDERYLKGQELKLDVLRGVILLDGAGYDIPRQIRIASLQRAKQLYTAVFSDDEARQRDASPMTHVEQGKGIPPFLILYVAARRDSGAQSTSLADKLQKAGVRAKAVPTEGKTHGTINRELGEDGDAPTQEVFAFLRKHSGR